MKLTGISKGAQEATLSSTSKISSWLHGWINGLQNLWSCYWQEEPASVTDLLSLLNNLLQTGTCCNQSLAIETIWPELTVTVWHIHQFLAGKGSNFSKMPCKAVRIESFFFFVVCVKTKDTQTASPTSTNCTETILAFLDYRQEKNGLLAPCCLLECTKSIAVAQCMLYIHWRPRGREGVHIPHMVTVT